MRWVNSEPIIQSEVGKRKTYYMLKHVYGLQEDGTGKIICRTTKVTDIDNRLMHIVGEDGEEDV